MLTCRRVVVFDYAFQLCIVESVGTRPNTPTTKNRDLCLSLLQRLRLTTALSIQQADLSSQTQPWERKRSTDFPPLGRFAVRDMRQTVAVGVIKAITKEEKSKKK